MYVRPRPRFRPRNAGGVAFSPALLFIGGTAGAWYDPSDYSTLFQDSAGTTPVTAVEQPVRLMLDKSQGLSGSGSQLVTNGDFSSPSTTGWQASNGGSFSVVSNRLQVTGAGATGTGAAYTLNTVVGMTYTVSFDVVLGTATVADSQMSLTVAAGASIGPSYQYCNVNGTYRYSFVATATTTYFQFHPRGAGNTASVDNFSVISLGMGNHATAPNDLSRPVLRARYNLLTYSEQFDNAAWIRTGLDAFGSGSVVNATTAPDGTTTADFIRPGTVSSSQRFTQNPSPTQTAQTLSVYVKASGYSKVALKESATTGNYASFDLSTGSVLANTAGVGTSITALANSWYRISMTLASAASCGLQVSVLAPAYTTGDPNSSAFSGDGTSGMFVWGAMLNTGSSAGTYQRIAAATDYATAGFLPYLAFDGVDDILIATPASADYILNSVAFGAQFNAFSGNATLGSIGNSATGNSFSYIAENSASSLFNASARNDAATTVSTYIGTPDLLPHVLISIWNASASSVQNNSSIVTGSALTGVMTSNKFTLGALGRNANSAFANSRIYSALFISPALTTAQSASLASYIAAKSGVTL